jgi:carbamoyl-phosphate synthase large subunit
VNSIDFEARLVAERSTLGATGLRPDLLIEAKEMGFSDQRLAQLLGVEQQTVRGWRADTEPRDSGRGA